MRTVVGFLFGLFAGAFLLSGVLATVERTGGASLGHLAGARRPFGSLKVTPSVVEGRPASASPVQALSGARPAPSPRVSANVGELFLVARMADDNVWEEVFLVDNGSVHQVPLPAEVDRSTLPVFDGEKVYAYARSSGNVRLGAFTLDGREADVVTDATPLVEPRGLFVSPTGDFLAYFLDNRQSSATELWTYDTAVKSKRVSVERLTRAALRGPFFFPDGSFLLRHGEQLLSGSPRRTGVDILPFALPREGIRWEGNVVRSPAGERVAVVVETGDDATTVARVLEYAVGDGSSRFRFPPTRSPSSGTKQGTRFSLAETAVPGRLRGEPVIRLLGWTTPDTLVLSTRAEPRFLWTVLGEVRTSRSLGPGATSPLLSGDGSAVGLLRADADGVRLEVVDVRTGHARVAATLQSPSPEPPTTQGGSPGRIAERFVEAPGSSRAGDAVPRYRLLQYLTVPLSAVAAPQSAPALPATLLLQHISANLRLLANAPEGEPVTPERVWLAAVPDTVYVDYRVGTTLWRRLVRVETKDGALTGVVVGVFAPAGGEWVLAHGEDLGLADRPPQTLYEFEPDLNQWVEKPLAEGAAPD